MDNEEFLNSMELNEDIAIEVEPEGNKIEASNTEHIDENANGLKIFEGMEFISLEKAEEVYKAFAKANGFTVRIRNTRPGSRGSITSRQFVCSCQGFWQEKKEKDLATTKEQERRTLTRRCGCEANVYTRNVFKLFQDELNEGIYMRTNEHGIDGAYTIYEVSCFRKPERKYIVHINLDSLEGWCQCHLFEFKGILCRHILGIFHKRDVEEIPAHFILPRWTKEVIYDMNISLPSKVDELPLILRNMVFYRMVNHLSTYLGASKETYHLIVDSVEEIYKKVVAIEGPIGVKKVEAPRHQEQTEHASLQDPALSQTKGRKKDSAKVSRKGRIMSGVEVSMKRRRKCGKCKQLDHDARTCEQHNQEC